MCSELSERGRLCQRTKRTYEVTLTAGETRVLACAVSSDRGFISNLERAGCDHGRPRLRRTSLNCWMPRRRSRVWILQMGEAAYRNTMADACRCLYAASDCRRQTVTRSAKPTKITVDIPPYLTQGGSGGAGQNWPACPLPETRGRSTGMLRRRVRRPASRG